MAEEVTARLSDPISVPELSRIWESERTNTTAAVGDGIRTWQAAPEIVISARGSEVVLSFPSGGPDREHRKLKAAFERAIHRHRPDVKVDWAA